MEGDYVLPPLILRIFSIGWVCVYVCIRALRCSPISSTNVTIECALALLVYCVFESEDSEAGAGAGAGAVAVAVAAAASISFAIASSLTLGSSGFSESLT